MLTFAPVTMPELKGRSPEEINLLFDEHVGALASRKWKPSNLRADLETQAGTEPNKMAPTEEETKIPVEYREE